LWNCHWKDAGLLSSERCITEPKNIAIMEAERAPC
jgi:hypothetical protein